MEINKKAFGKKKTTSQVRKKTENIRKTKKENEGDKNK